MENLPVEFQALFQQLLICIPTLSESQLRASIPSSYDAEGVFDWLRDCLEPNGLIGYMDWDEMFYSSQPGISELALLSELDLSQYDVTFIVELLSKQYSQADLEKIIEGTFDFSSEEPEYDETSDSEFDSPSDLPIFNYANHFLKPHHLRLIDINYQNPYILCVHDREEDIQKLNTCLKPYGLYFDARPPMDRREVVEKMVAQQG